VQNTVGPLHAKWTPMEWLSSSLARTWARLRLAMLLA
jgi:hypothetical protein